MNNIKHKTRKPNLNKKIHKLGPNEACYDWIERAYIKDADGRVLSLREDRCNIAEGSIDCQLDSISAFKRAFGLKPSVRKIEDAIDKSSDKTWTDGKHTIAFESWTTCESEPFH